MGAARTLLRKMVDYPHKKPTAKGTPFKHVVTEYVPTSVHPYEHSYHATKGARRVRVAL